MKQKEKTIQEIPAKTRNELLLKDPNQSERVCAYCRVSTDTDTNLQLCYGEISVC